MCGAVGKEKKTKKKLIFLGLTIFPWFVKVICFGPACPIVSHRHWPSGIKLLIGWLVAHNWNAPQTSSPRSRNKSTNLRKYLSPYSLAYSAERVIVSALNLYFSDTGSLVKTPVDQVWSSGQFEHLKIWSQLIGKHPAGFSKTTKNNQNKKTKHAIL